VAPKFGLLGYDAISHTSNPKGWIRVLVGSGSAVDKKVKLGILITFWWLVWKERNRRIFEARGLSVCALAYCIQDSITFQSKAWAQRI
jgi:hypothetical protein